MKTKLLYVIMERYENSGGWGGGSDEIFKTDSKELRDKMYALLKPYERKSGESGYSFWCSECHLVEEISEDEAKRLFTKYIDRNKN